VGGREEESWRRREQVRILRLVVRWTCWFQAILVGGCDIRPIMRSGVRTEGSLFAKE
jgi:hypothetical protein